MRLASPEADDSRAALLERIERLERALESGAGESRAPRPRGKRRPGPGAPAEGGTAPPGPRRGSGEPPPGRRARGPAALARYRRGRRRPGDPRRALHWCPSDGRNPDASAGSGVPPRTGRSCRFGRVGSAGRFGRVGSAHATLGGVRGLTRTGRSCRFGQAGPPGRFGRVGGSPGRFGRSRCVGRVGAATRSGPLARFESTGRTDRFGRFGIHRPRRLRSPHRRHRVRRRDCPGRPGRLPCTTAVASAGAGTCARVRVRACCRVLRLGRRRSGSAPRPLSRAGPPVATGEPNPAARPAPGPRGVLSRCRPGRISPWPRGDSVLGRLPANVKPYLSSGRFLGVDGAAAVYALKDPGMLARAQLVRPEAEAALARRSGPPVPLRLVLDDGTRPGSLPVADHQPAVAAEADEEFADYDLSELEDAPCGGSLARAALPGSVPGR